MANSSSKTKTLADPGASHLEFRFYPYANDTQAIMVVARGLGARSDRLRVWSGSLPVTRGDLRGLGPGQCAVVLSGLLRNALTADDGSALELDGHLGRPEAPAPPEGVMGAAVERPELPFPWEKV